MNDTSTNTICERTDDLISFLYSEASEHEARDFEKHLQRCGSCRNELASFGQVRESLNQWKEEALGGALVPQIIAPARKRSAIAALREFFDLSPLWMKGAVGLATVLFCVMALLLVSRSNTPAPSAPNEARYTAQEMKQAIAKALQDQEAKFAVSSPSPKAEAEVVKNNEKEYRIRRVDPARNAKWASRKPLSKSEREQLAADLRLLSSKDEDTLNLLADRINQEF